MVFMMNAKEDIQLNYGKNLLIALIGSLLLLV